jgi:hypothetical protein
MSISARTRQSTWSTDAPEASTGSGAQFCKGEARRHWAYRSFLREARNFARLAARRLSRPHPATRKSRSAASKSLHAERSAEATPQYPSRSLLRLAQTSRALSFELHANPRPRLQIAPRERFQIFVAKVWSVGLAPRDPHSPREARFEPPLSKGEPWAARLSAPSWRPRAALSLA